MLTPTLWGVDIINSSVLIHIIAELLYSVIIGTCNILNNIKHVIIISIYFGAHFSPMDNSDVDKNLKI